MGKLKMDTLRNDESEIIKLEIEVLFNCQME